jgi:hypothetical protein
MMVFYNSRGASVKIGDKVFVPIPTEQMDDFCKAKRDRDILLGIVQDMTDKYFGGFDVNVEEFVDKFMNTGLVIKKEIE